MKMLVILTITVAETADWLSYDDAAGGVLSGTPPVGAADVTVTVTATDSGGLTATDEFTIMVEPFAVTIDLVNQPPQVI